ncbi:MAG: sialidase family protein, partial [Myxococcota bacterium]
MAIDPVDDRFMYAGTAEGTVFVSADRGQTWQERPLEPFVQDRRRNAAPSLRTIRGIGGEDLRQNPVRRIAVCPGQRNNVLVVTRSALYGSQDHGLTFARLLGVFQREELRVVDCRAQCPGLVALATDQGLFTSTDGGLSFSAEATPVGKAVSTVEVDCEQGRRSVLFAQSRRLYRVDLNDGDIVPLYPSAPAEARLPAPSANIEDIEVRGDQIWLATNRGVQRSDDGGKTWRAFASDLGRFVRQVVVTPRQVQEVALVLDLAADTGLQSSSLNAIAVRSTDGGDTWRPLFAGLSQRRVRWLAPAAGPNAGWWLATSGGIWTEARPEARSGAPLLQRWAQQRLQKTRPLVEAVNASLRRSRLSAPMIASLSRGYRQRCWAPRVGLNFGWQPLDRRLAASQAGVPAVQINSQFSRTQTVWMATGSWD